MGSGSSSRPPTVKMEVCPLLSANQLAENFKEDYKRIKAVYDEWEVVCNNFLVKDQELKEARNKLLQELQIKHLGHPRTELVVKALVYSLLRREDLELSFQPEQPYIFLADKTYHDLYDAWRKFINATQDFVTENEDSFNAVFTTVDTRKIENLENTRRLIAAKKVEPIQAVQLLKPFYINNDKVAEVKIQFEKTYLLVKESLESFDRIFEIYSNEETLQTFKNEARSFPQLSQKQFIKKCRQQTFF